jgi:hypothetical protein
MPRGHPRLRAETPALRRAGTNDENDYHERITRMVMNGFLFASFAVIRAIRFYFLGKYSESQLKFYTRQTWD